MQFLRFDSLKNIPHLRHTITTRGGACNGPYDELNLAYHVGDDASRVTENRKKLAEELGYDAARLVAAQQVHGTRIKPVWEELASRGAFDWNSARPQCDGLIVQTPQIPVLIQVADCAPLLIVSQQKHMLAVVHAGWRGAVESIASDAAIRIKFLWVEKSLQTSEFKVGIGPCLCVNCFEIGPEVVEATQKIAPEAVIQRDDWEKPHLDLRLLLRRDLENVGVLPENIEVMPQCPRCQNDLFFSHRGQNGTAGRFGLIAWWEN